MARIILKSMNRDPWSKLHEIHPCAFVLYKNQRCLKTLARNLKEISKNYSMEELQDKSKRIQVYKEFPPQVVILGC